MSIVPFGCLFYQIMVMMMSKWWVLDYYWWRLDSWLLCDVNFTITHLMIYVKISTHLWEIGKKARGLLCDSPGSSRWTVTRLDSWASWQFFFSSAGICRPITLESRITWLVTETLFYIFMFIAFRSTYTSCLQRMCQLFLCLSNMNRFR